MPIESYSVSKYKKQCKEYKTMLKAMVANKKCVGLCKITYKLPKIPKKIERNEIVKKERKIVKKAYENIQQA